VQPEDDERRERGGVPYAQPKRIPNFISLSLCLTLHQLVEGRPGLGICALCVVVLDQVVQLLQALLLQEEETLQYLVLRRRGGRKKVIY